MSGKFTLRRRRQHRHTRADAKLCSQCAECIPLPAASRADDGKRGVHPPADLSEGADAQFDALPCGESSKVEQTYPPFFIAASGVLEQIEVDPVRNHLYLFPRHAPV